MSTIEPPCTDRPPAISRRAFLGLAAAGCLVAAPGAGSAAPTAGARPAPGQVLRELLAGNERFARGEPRSPRRRPEDYRALAEGQAPLAVILGCADSRVAPELLFDMGVGDLFVVRVAGNVVTGAGAAVKGSVEYAVAELHVPLVMVLGHRACGAVKAAITHVDAGDALPGAINDLVTLVRPAVIASRNQPGDRLDNAIRANVRLGVERLKGLSPLVAPRVRQGAVEVVGGVYDLHTGRVALVGEPR